LFLAARMIGFQKSLSLSKLNGVWWLVPLTPGFEGEESLSGLLEDFFGGGDETQVTGWTCCQTSQSSSSLSSSLKPSSSSSSNSIFQLLIPARNTRRSLRFVWGGFQNDPSKFHICTLALKCWLKSRRKLPSQIK
jgi:hypothetical protein